MLKIICIIVLWGIADAVLLALNYGIHKKGQGKAQNTKNAESYQGSEETTGRPYGATD